MRLVDGTIPFQIVYAIYHHEYFGYIISAHAVQYAPNNELSLVHQGVYPDNMDQFSQGTDEVDEKLISISYEIHPKTIIKKFGGDARNPLEFFATKYQGEVKKLISPYIQRRMAKMLALVADRKVFVMGKDGYPAQTPVRVLEDKASILFHFRRNQDFTKYYPTIKLFNERLEFQYQKAALICYEPAWLLLGGQLFTFEQQVDGKKLKPFLTKYYIKIDKRNEEEYYKKFVPQIIEKYHVYAKGFHIKTIRETPRFVLTIKNNEGNSFSFDRAVQYGRFSIPLTSICPVTVFSEKTEDSYIFFRVERNQFAERGILEKLEGIAPNQNSLSPWQYVGKEESLNWISTHFKDIESWGIRIYQPDKAYKLNLYQPEVSMVKEEQGDWFDIKAIVKIGSFEIPFIKFRGHILRNKREYKLPDGTVAILPEHWFSEFRHIMEVAEKDNQDGLRIKKYQAPLLEFPNAQGTKESEPFDPSEVQEIPSPKQLKAKLRNYQQWGLNWLYYMKEHSMGGILADDMGLGKTLQTLSLLLKEKELGNETPSLIILPTSLIQNWKNEAKKFAPKLKVHTYTGINRNKDISKFPKYDLILSTYGIVRQDIDSLKDFPFHYTILDESQMIKNPESKTAKAVRKLVSRHRLSLTGTPIENTVMDIWSQMAFLNPGLLGNENFFRKFYVHPIEKEKNEKRSIQLRKIIYPYVLRRTKQQVEKDLPPKVEKIHYCEMEESQKELYDKTHNSYRNYILDLINEGTWKKNKLNILTGLQKLRQLAIHPKMTEPSYQLEQSGKYIEVKRLLGNILNKKSKVLIFSQFVKMLHILRNDLEAEGIQFNYLDGSTRNRQKEVDSFQENPDIQVFLISLKAGGVGLNLTAADYVFILDPWWNPAVENQAVDRSHRIGQKNTVFYYKFITQGSIEEKILKLQRRKAKLSQDIISVEEDFYKSLTEDDFGELLK